MKAAALIDTPQTPPETDLARRQARSRRARSLAIGLVLAAFVVLVYVITIVKLGPGVVRGPM